VDLADVAAFLHEEIQIATASAKLKESFFGG
jgi:hypothetical protein